MKIDIEDCYKKYAPMVFRRCSFLLKNEAEALDTAKQLALQIEKNPDSAESYGIAAFNKRIKEINRS